ncbi:MAG: hypothetical protein IH934_04795 [Nanoarchaeota archaeon]|nr:hypothetical protein [Nanoarchaeota archaeon]
MQKKKRDEDLRKYITSIVKPIFEKVAEEAPNNRMLVGSKPRKKKYSYFNPHNYRRWFNFSRKTFNPESKFTLTKRNQQIWGFNQAETHKSSCKTNPLVQGWFRIINKTEYFFDNFYDCSIRVKKKTIQINNKKENKRKHVIILGEVQERKKQVFAITNRKDQECKEVLKLFISIFGGSSDFKIINKASENKCEHEDMIDKIPLKMTFDTPIVKKRYNEPNVEFTDEVGAANYFSTRGIEDIAPQIESRLVELKDHSDLLWEGVTGIIQVNKSTADTFSSFATNFLPIHKEHAINIGSHTKVLKNIAKVSEQQVKINARVAKSFNKFNILLSQKKLEGWF